MPEPAPASTPETAKKPGLAPRTKRFLTLVAALVCSLLFALLPWALFQGSMRERQVRLEAYARDIEKVEDSKRAELKKSVERDFEEFRQYAGLFDVCHICAIASAYVAVGVLVYGRFKERSEAAEAAKPADGART